MLHHIRALNAALFIACLGVPATAQDADILDLARELLEQDAANEATADQINKTLSECLPPVSTDAPETAPVTLAVDIGPGGKPARPADIVEPAPADATILEIQQLLRAEAAINACSPLTVEGKPARSVRVVLRATETTLEITEVKPLQAPVSPIATVADETALNLARDNRREIQIRLDLAGFPPGGADGIFGPRTRTAIAGFQTAQKWPVSGYLNTVQVEALVNNTQAAYVNFLEEEAAKPAPKRTSRKTTRRKYYRGSDGCLRYANGRIVPKQSFRCDARGLIDF